MRSEKIGRQDFGLRFAILFCKTSTQNFSSVLAVFYVQHRAELDFDLFSNRSDALDQITFRSRMVNDKRGSVDLFQLQNICRHLSVNNPI